MPTARAIKVIQRVRRAVLRHDGTEPGDAELLADYVGRRDGEALAALVRRHAPMVWGVCRRVLRPHHDAEDAFQATFLVLVRRAASLASPELLANWLYGVAHQTALKARAAAARRGARERQVTDMPEPAATERELWDDLQPLLDRELSGLPDKYRAAVVLCDLEGRTRTEAARQLGVPEGTLAARVSRERAMLARRLARHGLSVSAAALATTLAGSAAARAPNAVVSHAIKLVTGHAATARVAALTEGVVKAMFLTKLKGATAVLLALGLLAFGAGVVPRGPGGAARADQPEKPPAREPAAGPRLGIDLAKVDRAIRKEPAYVGKPRYALVVLGPKAGQRMWLVIDDKAQTLYADRNGDGDLTGADEKLALDKRETRLIPDVLEFHLGPFTEADGKTGHVDLVVTQYRTLPFDHPVNTVSVRDGTGEFGQTTNGEDGCSFAESPKDAPVIHLNGPLTLRAYMVEVEYDRGTGRKLKLVSGSGGLIDFPEEAKKGAEVPYQLKVGERVSKLHVQVGTPGLGKGTFAALSVEKGFDPKLHPVADIVTPGRTDASKFVTAKFPLKSRCCGTQFLGPVQLPAESAEGNGGITLSFPGLPNVVPAVIELPLVGPPAGGRKPGEE